MGVLKISEVIGLPVICIDSGKKIGTVEDLILNRGKSEVKALILERAGFEIRRKVILMKDIAYLGKDAVMVNTESCKTELRMVFNSSITEDKGEIRGLRVYSKSGEDLGEVKDVLFDSKTGTVEGVEVTEGLLQDIVQGRKILPLFGKVEFSEESMLVDREAVEEMMGTGGGIKNKLLKE
ncbi:MAG: PRC-barrel domain-containing protein [Acetivibrionales bacterium]|jgi:uncharacterized protein YrrD